MGSVILAITTVDPLLTWPPLIAFLIQITVFAEYNGDLYFTASDGNGMYYHVWRYRSSDASVTKISNALTRTGGYGLAVYNGKLYFGGTTAMNTNAPTDLYRWDGTTSELAPGFNSNTANPSQMIAYNGYLYLTRDAGVDSNIELYRYLDNGATGSVAWFKNLTRPATISAIRRLAISRSLPGSSFSPTPSTIRMDASIP